MPDRRGIVTGDHSPRKRVQARHLRHTMTPAEQTLWRHLRANRLGGHAFRRQQIIDGYIVDFYCHAAALVVEVDGDVHAFHCEADQVRQQALERRGLLVVRCTNRDVASHLRSVLEQILDLADRRAAELKEADA
jgi:very-short-patch-repair endonuclease